MTQNEKIWQDISAVAEVLSVRLPMLAMTLAHPTTERRLEAERMILEKADAAVDGFFSFHKYCFNAVMDAWHAPVANDHFQGAIDAYLAPGRETLKANAERLRGQGF